MLYWRTRNYFLKKVKRTGRFTKRIKLTRSIIPNLLTLGNVFSGFAAIICIADSDFVLATFYIVMAAVFDMFDGIVARILSATSEIGAELDSLCDAISFGVAPSFMIYKAYLINLGDWGAAIAAIPTLAGVLRLARFNVQLASFEDKLFFKGLPIPGAALTIISLVMFYVNTEVFTPQITKILVCSTVPLVGLCMISKIRFPNFPRPNKHSFKNNPVIFIGVIVAAVVGIVTQGKSIFPTMLVYIVYSIISYIVFFITQRSHKKHD